MSLDLRGPFLGNCREAVHSRSAGCELCFLPTEVDILGLVALIIFVRLEEQCLVHAHDERRSQAMLSERAQQDASSVRVLLRSFIPMFRMRCWGGLRSTTFYLCRLDMVRLSSAWGCSTLAWKSLRQNCFSRLIHNRMWETLRWGCHSRVSVRVSSRWVCSPLYGEKALRHGRRASCVRTCQLRSSSRFASKTVAKGVLKKWLYAAGSAKAVKTADRNTIRLCWFHVDQLREIIPLRLFFRVHVSIGNRWIHMYPYETTNLSRRDATGKREHIQAIARVGW